MEEMKLLRISKNRLALCSSVLLLALSMTSVRAQRIQIGQFPFPAGEELTYKAELSRSLLRGVDVAEFRFMVTDERITPVGAPKDDPVQIIKFTGDVASNGFFVKLFGLKFHEHVDCKVDESRFTLLQTTKVEEQNKRARSSEAIFDYSTHKVTWTERDQNNPSQPPRVATAEFTEPIHDVLSGIYFLRTQHLEVGKSVEVELSDSGRVFHLPIAVVERKRVRTAIGYVYALRVEPALFGDRGMVKGEGRFSIWLTDDDRHIPLRAQVKVPAGTFDIKLQRVTYQNSH